MMNIEINLNNRNWTEEQKKEFNKNFLEDLRKSGLFNMDKLNVTVNMNDK